MIIYILFMGIEIMEEMEPFAALRVCLRSKVSLSHPLDGVVPTRTMAKFGDPKL